MDALPNRPRRLSKPPCPQPEQAVLGGLLGGVMTLGAVADILAPEHFADPVHRHIFAEMRVLAKEGVPSLDVFLHVSQGGSPMLRRSLNSLGGQGYLIKVINLGQLSSYHELWKAAEWIKDQWRRREVLDAVDAAQDLLDEAVSAAFHAEGSPTLPTRTAAVFNKLQVHLTALLTPVEGAASSSATRFGDLVDGNVVDMRPPGSADPEARVTVGEDGAVIDVAGTAASDTTDLPF